MLSLNPSPTNQSAPKLLPPSSSLPRLCGEEERSLSFCWPLSVHRNLSECQPGSTMERGAMLAVCVLCWSGMVCVVTAIQRTDMFPYGSLSGDQILAEGDDETSRVLSLPRPVYFYDSLFSQLYVSSLHQHSSACSVLRKLCNQSVNTFCRRGLQLLDIFMERFISV